MASEVIDWVVIAATMPGGGAHVDYLAGNGLTSRVRPGPYLCGR